MLLISARLRLPNVIHTLLFRVIQGRTADGMRHATSLWLYCMYVLRTDATKYSTYVGEQICPPKLSLPTVACTPNYISERNVDHMRVIERRSVLLFI